jgi:excisionase family DNA binding protein
MTVARSAARPRPDLLGTRRERQLISIADAATRLDVNPRTIRRRIADGTITGYRVGARMVRVDVDELDKLLRPIPAAGRRVS